MTTSCIPQKQKGSWEIREVHSTLWLSEVELESCSLLNDEVFFSCIGNRRGTCRLKLRSCFNICCQAEVLQLFHSYIQNSIFCVVFLIHFWWLLWYKDVTNITPKKHTVLSYLCCFCLVIYVSYRRKRPPPSSTAKVASVLEHSHNLTCRQDSYA